MNSQKITMLWIQMCKKYINMFRRSKSVFKQNSRFWKLAIQLMRRHFEVISFINIKENAEYLIMLQNMLI